MPPPEHVHWLFATGFVFLGLCLLAETIAGTEVWRRRRARAYLWPGVFFAMGLLMWPVMTFYTSSLVHMLAHGAWAQVMMLAGGAHIALISGKLRSRYWELTMPLAFLVSGAAFLFHAFWAVPPEEAAMQRIQFLKNLAIMGGLLYVTVYGSGPVSASGDRE